MDRYFVWLNEKHDRSEIGIWKSEQFYDLGKACEAARQRVKESDPLDMLEAVVSTAESGLGKRKLVCWIDAQGKYHEKSPV